MPTYDDPRLIRKAFANPFIDMQLENEDTVVSTVPLPDKGDPSPFQFTLSLGRQSGRTATRTHPVRVTKCSQGSMLLVQDQRMTSGLVSVQELGARAQPMMLKSNKAEGFAAKATGVGEQLTVQDIVKVQSLYLKFHVFFHPHVCDFIKTLNHLGVTGLLTLGSQELDNDPQTGNKFNKEETVFDDVYGPAPIVHDDYPQEDVDFRPEGAYSLYNC